MPLLELLGIRHPIIQAPMGGGPGTPALAAAVTNAGALGSLACAYLSTIRMRDEIQRTRAMTNGPLNVNLFAGGYHEQLDRDPAPMLAIMRDVHQHFGLPEPVVPDVGPDPFPRQLEIVLELRPRIFSFTFGIPSEEALRRLREAQIVIIGTATTFEEARLLAEAGVDAIVAQGAEAGAHRGTFAHAFEEAMVPTLDLVVQIASRIRVPVIASGGIMNGADIAAALRAGASAVQMGTAFLLCDEAGTADAYRHAIRKGGSTVITRAYSGRAARGIHNAFIDRVPEDDILPFPIQNSLTRAMRSAAAKAGDAEHLSLWAGTGLANARALPAAQLIDTLMEEVKAAAKPPHS